MLISESYRDLNKQLHESNASYGTSGHRYVGIVRQLVEIYQTRDVLDYGCGKRTLESSLGFPICNYDPCISGLDAIPESHDIVACTDVLEHIEPENLSDVLSDIRRCARKAAFLLVATRPAIKFLADGRNAHLIQQPYEWWRPEIERAGFSIKQYQPLKGEFAVICE